MNFNFSRLKFEDGIYKITKKVDFYGTFIRKQYINSVFEYSFQCAYNNKSKYIAGSRNKHEIFANIFKGKLAEFCVYDNISNYRKISLPKIQYIQGSNDGGVDINMQGIGINVKSSSKWGNLLLLKSSDWNKDNASYKYSLTGQQCDIFIFVRIDPDSSNIMKQPIKQNIILKDKQILCDLITNIRWKYDIPGWINRQQLKYIMNNNFLIKSGDKIGLNSFSYKHDNYYVYAADLNPINDIYSYKNY